MSSAGLSESAPQAVIFDNIKSNQSRLTSIPANISSSEAISLPLKSQ